MKLEEIKLEEINSLKTSSDSGIERSRSKQMELQSSMDKAQQEYYKLGAEISRSEQEIKLKKETITEVSSNIHTTNGLLESKKQELGKFKGSLVDLKSSISLIEPQLEKLLSLIHI